MLHAMSQRAARPTGQSTKSGRKFVRADDGLPTARELRELSQRLDASSRRSRCGRPGRNAAPEYWARVLAKLTAASKGGRGIRFLTRDELDAVLQHCAPPHTPAHTPPPTSPNTPPPPATPPARMQGKHRPRKITWRTVR